MILFYRIIVLTLSFVSIISIMMSSEKLPQNLVVLPLVFVCLYFLLPMFSRYMFNNIGITIVNLTMLIRYTISPLLMSIYGVNVSIGSSTSIDSQTKAIYLMLFEMVSIIVFFSLFSKKFYNNENKIEKNIAKPNPIGWLFIILSILIAVVQPEVINRYTFIWSASELKTSDIEIGSIAFLVVQLAQIILTISLLNFLYGIYEKKKNVIYLILSFLVVGISASFISGTSRFSIVLPLVTGLFIIYILYKNYRKIILFCSAFLSFLLILTSTLLKKNTISSQVGFNSSITGSSFEKLNSELQLYFSGVVNVSHAIDTSYYYSPFQLGPIISELLRSVVFVNSLFDSQNGALNIFNEVFYNKVLVSDQILPMVGQGFLYFGPILAPIFSIASILSVMYLDNKVHSSNSIFKKYIMTYLCVKFALFFMVNATIQISFFTNFFLVLLVINYLNNKLTLKKV